MADFGHANTRLLNVYKCTHTPTPISSTVLAICYHGSEEGSNVHSPPSIFCLFQKRCSLVLPRWSKSWLYWGDYSYVQCQLSSSLAIVVCT